MVKQAMVKSAMPSALDEPNLLRIPRAALHRCSHLRAPSEVPRILVTVPRGVLAQAKRKRFPVRLRMPSRLASPDSVSEAASILCDMPAGASAGTHSKQGDTAR